MRPELDPDDTIAAIASAPGPGLRGIVRLSGPKAWTIALEGFRTDRPGPPPRAAAIHLGELVLPGLRPPLPVLLALWPGPRTYTGQDVAEVHLPGAPPLLELALGTFLGRGARLARPGEFTLRAFLSGRIDLTRAEAVMDVIGARTERQLAAALDQLAGGISGPIGALRSRLLDLLAHLEAGLDFVDEEDVDELARAAISAELDVAAGSLESLAGRLARRDRTDVAPRVVIAGPPNAGKSRLFNALLGDDRAIVSHLAGTTRDYVSASCDLGGLVVELVDTAGLDAPRDAIDARAQQLGAEQAATADLVLLCASPDTKSTDESSAGGAVAVLRVWNKADLGIPESGIDPAPILTSATTGAGLDALRSEAIRLLTAEDSEGASAAGTGARCRDSLLGATAALSAAATTLRAGGGDELIAMDLRLALDELGKVVGAVFTDDILDRIFQRFCIGK